MVEFINKTKLVEYLERAITVLSNMDRNDLAEKYRHVIRVLDTCDVISTSYCKDCNYSTLKESPISGETMYFCNKWEHYMKPDDFCSKGDFAE